MAARAVSFLFGAWLFLSAFFWPHNNEQVWNALVCGALVVAFTWLAAGPMPRLRFGNTLVGAWLVLSSFVVASWTRTTVWNHILVGVGVLMLSLFPNTPTRTGLRGPRVPATAGRAR